MAPRKTVSARAEAPPPEAIVVQPSLFPAPEHLAPLPRQRSRPFRSELTVEQASLFVSNDYKGEWFERQVKVQSPEHGGQVVLQRLRVGKLHDTDRARGVLRQIHQDALYKVLQLWGQQGYPVADVRGAAHGHIRTTAYGLVHAIFPGDDSARTYRRVRELLRDLQAVPVVLENVFTWQGLRDREEFTLLASVSWSERGLDERGVPSRAEGSESCVTIMLSALVTQGFLAKHSKILLGEPYDSLVSGVRGQRSEIARLLYPFLDEQLSRRSEYVASLVDLATRFGLAQYPYPSKRREKFEPAVRALNGKPIAGGNFELAVELVSTEAPKDVVLRARRVVGAGQS